MNNLQIFKNEEFGEVRSLEINNKIYFVGKDIADILIYKEPHKAVVNHVDEDDRIKYPIIDELGRSQETWLINESGLYSLIISSKLPTAKRFKKWVTSEVLPSIRKTGGYIAGEENMNEDELILKAMNVLNLKVENLKQKNNLLEAENNQKDQIIGELKPKADYTDKILQSKGTVKINTIANDYGLTAIAMNKMLHNLGIQYKQGKDWLLYGKYRGKGYTHSKTIHFKHKDGTPDTNINMEWTQKGRLFLYEVLKNNGLIPMIERI